MASGVQVAISMSNTGGAWDNAKKYIERATPDSDLQGKGSDIHKVRKVKHSSPWYTTQVDAECDMCCLAVLLSWTTGRSLYVHIILFTYSVPSFSGG